MVIIAQGKYSKPRAPKQPDVQQPIPPSQPRQVMPDPIEDIPEEVAAFLLETDREEAAAFAPQSESLAFIYSFTFDGYLGYFYICVCVC